MSHTVSTQTGKLYTLEHSDSEKVFGFDSIFRNESIFSIRFSTSLAYRLLSFTMLSNVNSTLSSWVKVGFHYPSLRAELTARELGCIFWHPSTRAVNSGSGNRVHGRPVSTTRVDGCQKMHPSSRAVNSARELGPWTRVVETDLHSHNFTKTSAVTSVITTEQSAVILNNGTMPWRMITDQANAAAESNGPIF